MSPEYRRIADKRSDVWAFGCVLYEMLAGKRIFDGEDVSETLAAVLRADPDWTKLPASLPGGVRALLQRCLERDRKTRIPDMAVVRFLLLDAMAAPASSAPPEAPAAGRARPVWLAAAFGGGIGLTALGVWAMAAWTPAPPSPQPMRFAITPPAAQRLAPTIADRQMTISPDGKFIAYISGSSSAGGQLMVRPIDALEATPITGVVGARAPFFSPDGKWIGYFGPTDLRKVSTAGGPSVPLCPVDGPPRGGTWAADDTIIFATAQPGTGLQRVLSGGGTPANLTAPAIAQGEGDHVFPSALPAGRGVVFTIVSSAGQVANAQIAVLDLKTGVSSTLIRGGSHPSTSSRYLVYAAGNAAKVRFDAVRPCRCWAIQCRCTTTWRWRSPEPRSSACRGPACCCTCRRRCWPRRPAAAAIGRSYG
jgi:serine/threonine-protein kinase